MNTYKIPEPIHPQYHGAGYAMAATQNGEVIKLTYLRDIFEEFDDYNGDDGDDTPPDQAAITAYLQTYLTNPAIEPTLRELNALGNVSFGMCSCYEFCEL